MKKTHKILLLDSNKQSLTGDRIRFNSKGKLLISTTPLSEATDQHLYIISDEEIKERDWCISDEPEYSAFKWDINCPLVCKKVIASTDKSLGEIPNSVPGFNFPDKKALSSIPESFIQAYIKSYNEGNPITEVDLEYEEINKEKVCVGMTGKPARPYYEMIGKIVLKLREDNTVIIHQSKTYTSDFIQY